MAKYRNDLPLTEGSLFLADGGMETTLLFHDGIDLPHFAAFVQLESAEGRARLVKYYETYLAIARERGLGFVLDTATWRASADWGRLLGYDAAGLAAINAGAVALIADLRTKWETPDMPIVLNGAIGPRGDGYKAGRMDAAEAEDYHAAQIATFAATEADTVSAVTMNTVNEAIGIAQAAKAHGMPSVISFTVETDGRLVDGTTLREAIETTEAATGSAPVYYMINCAHPTHFDQALERGEAWTARIGGIRANASTMSHAELDESETLDDGDPKDLGRRYGALRKSFPALRVMGGCCGTDHRHIAAVCEAVAPAQAA